MRTHLCTYGEAGRTTTLATAPADRHPQASSDGLDLEVHVVAPEDEYDFQRLEADRIFLPPEGGR